MKDVTAPHEGAAYYKEASSSPGEGSSSFSFAKVFGWAGRHARPRFFVHRAWAFLLIGVLVAALVAGCNRSADRPAKVLLLAMDGLEWQVLLPLMAAGDLPNFSALLTEGMGGRLETSRPTFSPIIWTSIATGKTPAEHGIRGFVRRGEGSRRLFNSLDRQTKAFWNVLSDYSKRIAVVGWWMTFPAEPINGVMVAQAHTLDQARRGKGKAILKGGLRSDLADQISPPERSEEILAAHAQVQEGIEERLAAIFGPAPETMSPLAERLWLNTTWAFRADAAYAEISKNLAAEGYDLVACYLGGADVAGHRFWRYMRPGLYRDQPPRQETAWFGKIIPKYYVFLDNVLGELREQMPDDALVIVVSDHGMRPVNRQEQFDAEAVPEKINSGHHHGAPPGVFIAGGGQVVPTADSVPETPAELPVVGTIYDVLPTLLAALDIPIAEDLKGEVMAKVATDHGRRVATFDSAEWLESRGVLIEDTVPESSERLEQLRALGYID